MYIRFVYEAMPKQAVPNFDTINIFYTVHLAEIQNERNYE